MIAPLSNYCFVTPMNIKFSKPLAYSKDYPAPEIKGLPSFRLSDFTFKRVNYTSSSSFFSINGRSGLALIGQHLQLKKGDVILLPAYHCPALVEPFIWLGVTIRFYHLNKDLSVNIDDFAKKIDDSVKVCLFVHYFGFTPDFSIIALLAKKNNIAIIEDCAHSFYSPFFNNKKNTGDYSVVSCNKFFPCIDGSIIYGFNDKSLTKKLKRPSLFSDFKVFLNIFPLITRLIELIKKLVPKRSSVDGSEREDIMDTEEDLMSFRYFDSREINQACSRISQFIVEHSKHKILKKKRQDNFRFLLSKLIDSSVGKPLFTVLPKDVVPYVFPFILNDSKSFDRLKNAGLSLFRWEELADSDCPISQAYRDCLVQIPCHQDLTEIEMDKIIAIIQGLKVNNTI